MKQRLMSMLQANWFRGILVITAGTILYPIVASLAATSLVQLFFGAGGMYAFYVWDFLVCFCNGFVCGAVMEKGGTSSSLAAPTITEVYLAWDLQSPHYLVMDMHYPLMLLFCVSGAQLGRRFRRRSDSQKQSLIVAGNE